VNKRPIVASRAHQLVRIYAANSPATDLMVLGNFKIALKDGNSVEFDFTARFIISERGTGGKFQYVEVWTDGTAMQEAVENARQTLAAGE
jgi:hypothetical protein